MSSVGFGLLRSIIDNSMTLSELHETGVNELFFIGSERTAYNFIYSYFMDLGGYPQDDTITIEINNPTCFDNLPNEPPEYWIQKVKDRRRHNLSTTGLSSIREKLENRNINGAVDEFGRIYTSLRETYSEFKTIDLRYSEREVIERHNEVQLKGTIPGIPFGFPYLDAVSGGAQPGDSSVIAGITGCGKSMLAFKCGLTAWYSGANVLCLCTEMPVQQVSRRLLAMECNFDSNYLKLGRLSYFGVQRALQIIDSPLSIDGEVANNWFKLLPGGLYSNLDDILLITRELHPDLLIVDGASLVRIKNYRAGRWERMIDVMESIKHFAMQEGISTLSTYHFNKQQPGTTEGIYGGLAMSQLASIIMAFEFERKEDRENPSPVQYRILRLLKGRDGETGKLRVLYNMIRSTIVQDRVLAGYANIGEEGRDVEYIDDNPSAVI